MTQKSQFAFMAHEHWLGRRVFGVKFRGFMGLTTREDRREKIRHEIRALALEELPCTSKSDVTYAQAFARLYGEQV